MSHITVRYSLVGLAVSAIVVTSGSAAPQSGQSKHEPSYVAAVSMPLPTPLAINPIDLSKEVPNSSNDQQRLTLGTGECLDAVLEETVMRMDPGMNRHQVADAVDVLMKDIQTEAPNANLRTLSPGVSVVVIRKLTPHGVMWDALLGKYSGIT